MVFCFIHLYSHFLPSASFSFNILSFYLVWILGHWFEARLFFFSSVLSLSQIPWISIYCIFMFFEVRVLSNIPYEILTHGLFRIVFINFWMFWKRYISRYSSVLIIYLVSFFGQCIYFYDFFHFSVFRFVLMAQNVVYLSECSVCKRIHVQLLGEVLYKY